MICLYPLIWQTSPEYFYHMFCNRLSTLEDKCFLRGCPYCAYNQAVLERLILFQRVWRRFHTWRLTLRSPQQIMYREVHGSFQHHRKRTEHIFKYFHIFTQWEH